jgi:hypothetical protein
MAVRGIVLTGLVAAATAAVLGGTSLATATSGTQRHVFVLKEVQVKSTFINLSHTQNGAPGDEFIFRSKMLERDGVRVGWIQAVCTLVFNNQLQCEGTFTLPGGTLAASALVGGSNATPVAINGGTGRYAGWTGQETSVGSTTNVNVSTDTFVLRSPD